MIRFLSRSLILSFPLLALSFLPVSPSFAQSTGTEAKPAPTETEEFTITPPLTPEQEAQIQLIDTKYESKLKAAIADYNASQESFERILGTNPSTEELRSKRARLVEDRRKISDLLFDQLMDMREVLTPEQKASLSEYIRQSLAN